MFSHTKNDVLSIMLLMCLGHATLACKEQITIPDRNSPSKNDNEMPMQLSEMLNNEELYAEKKVTVSGFLFTHEEGPWLASNWRNPMANSIELEIRSESRLILPSGLESVWWFNSPKDHTTRGYAATIEGILKIVNRKHSTGHVFKTPVLEVFSASVSGIRDEKCPP